MTYDVLIIGGGLSGLHTAFELHRQGQSFLLIEGRKRLGGRILSKNLRPKPYDSSEPGFDLGPAWFWPGQKRMADLVHQLGLEPEVVQQFAEGEAIFESQSSTQRGFFGASMAGSFRLRGGMRQLVARLAREVPTSRQALATRATELVLEGSKSDGRIEAHLETPEGNRVVSGRRVVLALPPRVAVTSLTFMPELPVGRRDELKSLPTWMAGHGKFVALYDEPFWRSNGLSGDAISYLGPLSEIHDATPTGSGPAALFGFYGVPASVRKNNSERLKQACLEQLIRLFGENAAQPLQVYSKDWAFDQWTAITKDLSEPAAHSLTGLSAPREESWQGRLLWSGSETASTGERNNGYLEGALESSWRSLKFLNEPLV